MEYNMHRLRHYHASIMLALGVPDKYAAEQLGHSDTRITRDVYQHSIQALKAEIAQQIAVFYSMQHEKQHGLGKDE